MVGRRINPSKGFLSEDREAEICVSACVSVCVCRTAEHK